MAFSNCFRICTIVGIKSCSGFSLSCCSCRGELRTDQCDAIFCDNCACGAPSNSNYRVIIEVVYHMDGINNSKSVQLVGNCLNQLLGMPSSKLHSFLSKFHLTEKSVLEALRFMLVGQCALMNINSLPPTPGITAVTTSYTHIQLVGGGCQTILSYPPLSSTNSSHSEISPSTPVVSASLSDLSQYFTPERTPLLLSPSPTAVATHFTSSSSLFRPIPSLKTSKLNEATPELFSQCSSCSASPELIPAHAPYYTPSLTHRTRSPKTLLFTPEIL